MTLVIVIRVREFFSFDKMSAAVLWTRELHGVSSLSCFLTSPSGGGSREVREVACRILLQSIRCVSIGVGSFSQFELQKRTYYFIKWRRYVHSMIGRRSEMLWLLSLACGASVICAGHG